MIVSEQFGTVRISYDVEEYPHLFNTRHHPQQPAYPTAEVIQWLREQSATFWSIHMFYQMDIRFGDRKQAMLFKLTFA